MISTGLQASRTVTVGASGRSVRLSLLRIDRATVMFHRNTSEKLWTRLYLDESKSCCRVDCRVRTAPEPIRVASDDVSLWFSTATYRSSTIPGT